MRDTTSQYGTRWVRALMLMIGALVPVSILGAATAQNVLAMGMATQSLRGTFVTDGVVTNDPIGIILTPQLAKDSSGNTYTQYVVKLQAANVTVKGLCVAEKVSVFGQTMTVLIESGDRAIQVSGVWATLHTANTSLSASGSLQLNQNAADVVAGGESLGGLPGELGISARGASLGPADGTLQAAMIKGASIADFSARLVAGDVSCG